MSRLCKGCSLSRFNLWQLLRNKVKGLLCCHFSSVVEGPVHKGQVSWLLQLSCHRSWHGWRPRSRFSFKVLHWLCCETRYGLVQNAFHIRLRGLLIQLKGLRGF